jgi:hypothetical protein
MAFLKGLTAIKLINTGFTDLPATTSLTRKIFYRIKQCKAPAKAMISTE